MGGLIASASSTSIGREEVLAAGRFLVTGKRVASHPVESHTGGLQLLEEGDKLRCAGGHYAQTLHQLGGNSEGPGLGGGVGGVEGAMYEIDLGHQCARDTGLSVWLLLVRRKYLHHAKQKDGHDIGFSIPAGLHNGDNLDGLRDNGHVGENVRNAQVDEECFLCPNQPLSSP
jgi:hypothetical protein